MLIDTSIQGLILYFEFNTILYSFYSAIVFSIYFTNYLFKKFNHIKNRHMIFDINYRILNRIYYIFPVNEQERIEERLFLNDVSVV